MRLAALVPHVAGLSWTSSKIERQLRWRPGFGSIAEYQERTEQLRHE